MICSKIWQLYNYGNSCWLIDEFVLFTSHFFFFFFSKNNDQILDTRHEIFWRFFEFLFPELLLLDFVLFIYLFGHFQRQADTHTKQYVECLNCSHTVRMRMIAVELQIDTDLCIWLRTMGLLNCWSGKITTNMYCCESLHTRFR